MGQSQDDDEWVPPAFELPEEPDPLWQVRYNFAHFKSSHNSYQSGRGGLIQQLDAKSSH